MNNAFNLVVRLRFDDARSELSRIKKSQPANLATVFIEDYIDFISLMLTEDKALLRKIQRNKNARLDLIDRYARPGDPYFLLMKAEIYMHWALVDFRFGNNVYAFTAALKAYKLLEENKALFPEFIPNRKIMGLMHILTGSMPPSFKGGFSFFTGIHASVRQGMQELSSVMNDKDPTSYIFSYEARIMYAFIQMYINQEPSLAWNLLKQEKVSYHAQPLLAFLHAGVAYRAQKGDECISILAGKTYDKAYFSNPMTGLMLGRAKLNRLDRDANVWLMKFLSEYKGQNFIKEAHLLLYWYYTIFPDRSKKEQHRNAVLTLGSAKSDSDNAAMQEVRKESGQSAIFLKARLLYDGGYSASALKELEKLKDQASRDAELMLEYNYRYARILQQMNDTQGAIKVYRNVISAGRKHPEYFACNAALQIAIICEKSNQPANARFYYNECLSIRPASYSSSLHAKAKAGLLRLK